ncbi:MAG: hypothetical protein JWP08_1151 [Bryobacterales bacterium]|jgi:uncharacterized protein (DUF1697 family)|nr:hypothetical protein [Bryobacterales bacterium]
MPAFISLLRGINVGGHHQLKMDALRDLYRSLGFKGVQSYVQSGNVLFWSKEEDVAALAARVKHAIEKTAGFGPDIILRTCGEMETVVAGNPFAGREEISPSKLLVTFFEREPSPEAKAKVNEMSVSPEEFKVLGRELYVYFPEGVGRSKFPAVSIGRTLNVSGTARNWNTVLKLLEMARRSELSG